MHKKLVAASTGLAILAALAFSSSASASTLTEPPGVPLPVGASVTANSTGHIVFTGGFNLTCETLHIVGTVSVNNDVNPWQISIPVGGISIHDAGNTPCTSALGNTTVTVTSKVCLAGGTATDTVKATGCGANVVFDLKAAGITCKYETASLSGTFATNVTPLSAVLSEQPAKEVGGLFFCPDEGKWHITVDLYTTNGTGITAS